MRAESNSAADGASELPNFQTFPLTTPNLHNLTLIWIIPYSQSQITMAPLVPVFPAESLPDHVNTIRRNFIDKRRKGEPVNLKECPLLEMTQFSCNPPQNGVPEPGVVVCEPVVRLFRR